MKSLKRSFAIFLAMLVLAASSTGCARTTVTENDGYSEKSQSVPQTTFLQQATGQRKQKTIPVPTPKSQVRISRKKTLRRRSPHQQQNRSRDKNNGNNADLDKTLCDEAVYDKAARTTQPTTAPPTAVSYNLDGLLGKSGTQIRNQFGSPATTQKSEYGFTWHIYHKRYADSS
jgi:hypothetical protein